MIPLASPTATIKIAPVIHSTLTHADRYATLHPAFPSCLAFLKAFDPATPTGRYEVKGTDAFALVQHYETAPASTKPIEAHRKMIDIQFLATGSEIIQVTPPRRQHPSTEYTEEKDCQLFDTTDDISDCILQAGELAFFFPEDLHKPGCTHGEAPRSVIKVVVKVPV